MVVIGACSQTEMSDRTAKYVFFHIRDFKIIIMKYSGIEKQSEGTKHSLADVVSDMQTVLGKHCIMRIMMY